MSLGPVTAAPTREQVAAAGRPRRTRLMPACDLRQALPGCRPGVCGLAASLARRRPPNCPTVLVGVELLWRACALVMPSDRQVMRDAPVLLADRRDDRESAVLALVLELALPVQARARAGP